MSRERGYLPCSTIPTSSPEFVIRAPRQRLIGGSA